MRTAAFLLATVLAVLAVPAVRRTRAALDEGSRGRVLFEGARAVLAITAATALLIALLRTARP